MRILHDFLDLASRWNWDFYYKVNVMLSCNIYCTLIRPEEMVSFQYFLKLQYVCCLWVEVCAIRTCGHIPCCSSWTCSKVKCITTSPRQSWSQAEYLACTDRYRAMGCIVCEAAVYMDFVILWVYGVYHICSILIPKVLLYSVLTKDVAYNILETLPHNVLKCQSYFSWKSSKYVMKNTLIENSADNCRTCYTSH